MSVFPTNPYDDIQRLKSEIATLKSALREAKTVFERSGVEFDGKVFLSTDTKKAISTINKVLGEE